MFYQGGQRGGGGNSVQSRKTGLDSGPLMVLGKNTASKAGGEIKMAGSKTAN